MMNRSVFILKLCGFAGLIFALQWAMLLVAGDRQYGDQRVLLNKIDNLLSAGSDLLFLGDSTVIMTCVGEGDAPGLFEQVRERLDGVEAAEVAHPAYSLTQYEVICKYICRQSRRPEAIVVPVNIRSFSTGWDLRPEWQFQREKLYVDYDGLFFRLFYGPLTRFNAPFFDLTPVKMHEFLEAPVFNGKELAGKMREFYIDFGNPPAEPDLKKQFVLCYMHSISPTHRKARSLQSVARLCRESGIKAVFYITPVDYQSGEEYLGAEFDARLKENVATLEQLARQAGVRICDYSRLLPREMFCPPPFMPNEHMTEEGRALLAGELAKVLQESLSGSGSDL